MMLRTCGVLAILFLTLAAGSALLAQASGKTAPAGGPSIAERGITLAESGHCTEALPLLKKSIRGISDSALKKRVGLDGLHCAMTRDAQYESLEFLEVLDRDFPNDPEVLYAATHAFSDLSVHTSEKLMRDAPFSFQVHELNAESLETQGKWDEAAAEYRKILEINPLLPGMHSRMGRALLSKPQPSPADVEQAKKDFEEELSINPNDPTAEYVLGELAKDANDLPTAVRHFSRAAQLDASFSEAYLGLGESLVMNKRFADAIQPLEKYEKLAPDSPTGHYQLALAYSGAGRKEDANREAALQRETSANLESMKRKVAEGLLQQQPSGQTTQPQPQQDSQPHPPQLQPRN